VERKDRGVNRKELRKLRAALVSEKTKALGPLEKRIAEVEGSIVRLEKAAEESSQALLAASERSDADAIAGLSRQFHESRDRMDTLFDELESITAEFELKSREYEARLRAFDED